APSDDLGQDIDLVIVAAGKGEELRGESLQPFGTRGKPNRAARKQVALRNQTSALVGLWLVGRDIDRLLAQALDQARADRRLLDEKGAGAIAPLDLHHFPLERLKPQAAADHLQNIKDLSTAQQNDTCGVIAGFGLAQRDVPAHNNAVAGLVLDPVIGGEPFALDDS